MPSLWNRPRPEHGTHAPGDHVEHNVTRIWRRFFNDISYRAVPLTLSTIVMMVFSGIKPVWRTEFVPEGSSKTTVPISPTDSAIETIEPAITWKITVFSSEQMLVLIAIVIGVIWNPLSRTIEITFRPQIPTDCVRIEWTCYCGAELFADYPNTDPEMIAQLSGQLNRIESADQVVSAFSSQQSSLAGVPASGQGVNSSMPGSGMSMDHLHSSSSIMGFRTWPSRVLFPSRYLELCVNTGSLRQSLRELDVTYFTSDSELFRWIRKSYTETRGSRVRRDFHLRPRSIRFVYFGLERRAKVHILCKDESFPPEDEVLAGRYHYTPCPLKPEGVMPMPSDAFIHYLNYCNLDAEVLPSQRTWLDRLPKKGQGPLMTTANATSDTELTEAWGVHIIEGVDRAAVLWAMIVVLTLSLVPLLAAYISLTGDVQSATGVASVVIGVWALLWMCLQIDIGRNT